MKKFRSGTSLYLEGPSHNSSAVKLSSISAHNNFARKIVGVLALFMAAVVIGTTFIGPGLATGQSNSSTIFADEEDDVRDAANDYADNWEDAVERYQNEGRPPLSDDNSFGHVMYRLFSTSYLNHTPEAVPPGDLPDPPYGGGNYNCSTEDPNAGRATYHNCDVPNITTEFLQDLVSLFFPSGPANAERDVATLDSHWFGLPGNIPNDGVVPVEGSDRDAKYTALEIYGYGLSYTAYQGEWDHIKVMTSARALANYTFMDHLKLGLSAIFNGISAGVSQGVSNFIDSITSGDLLGAIGGFFSGLFGGGGSAVILTYLDSSDLNVFNTNAWYRIGYGPTLYGARELSQDELSELLGNLITRAFLEHFDHETAPLPDDLESLQEFPEDPAGMISSCEIRNAGGDWEDFGDVSESPGPTESACQTAAEEAVEGEEDVDAQYRWEQDGTYPGETLEEWRNNNSYWFDTAASYDITCDVDVDNEENKLDEIAEWRACAQGAVPQAIQDYRDDEMESIVDQIMDGNPEWVVESVMEAIQEDPAFNYNAPWNRFVCVDADGRDMQDTSTGWPYPVFNPDGSGSYSGHCGEIRPPIQNGFFGNGYISSADYPGSGPAPTDTRYAQLDTNIGSVLFPVDFLATSAADFGLGFSIFMTRVMNTVVNLMFSPILETFGLDTMIENLIEDFRESIFFPFVVLFIALAGAWILFQAGRTQQYRQQFMSALLLVLTFITGVVLMYRPDLAIKVTDEGPAMVERAVMGTIFGVGNDGVDELCTATGTPVGAEYVDLEGNVLPSPDDATRTVMCEVWRTFAFTPWVYGQWGVGSDHLYAAGSGVGNPMENTNGDLVGNAAVEMGNGVTVENWALYQLEVTTSGTSTTRDIRNDPNNVFYGHDVGRVSPDFYRLVDLQAGPNNGAGTDPRFFQSWSGADWGERVVAGFGGGAVSILGLIVILIYGFVKIQITFVMLLMLLAMPLVFLLAMLPVGRLKMKQYFMTIAGLMLQRIMLVALIAIMLRLMSGFTTSSDSYITVLLGTIAVCIVFIALRKTILGKIMGVMTDTSGGIWGGNMVERPGSAIKEAMPRSVQQFGAQRATAFKSGIAGAAGGFLVGGVTGARKGRQDAQRANLNRLDNANRRDGLGGLQSTRGATRAGHQTAKDRAATSDNKGRIAAENERRFAEGLDKSERDRGYSEDELTSARKAQRQNEIAEERRNAEDEGRDVDLGNVETPEQPTSRYTSVKGRVTPKGKQKEMSARDLRRINKLQDADHSIDAARDKRDKSVGKKASRKIRSQTDLDSIVQQQEAFRQDYDNFVAPRESNFEKLMDETADMEVRRANRSRANQEFKDSLANLKDNFRKTQKSAEDFEDKSRDSDSGDEQQDDRRS